MTISVDTTTAATRTGLGTTNTISHAGAASGVKGVLVCLMQETGSTDFVSGVTYGGQALARVVRAANTGPVEPGAADIWFLGTGVPQATNDAVYTLTSATGNDYRGVVITLLGAADLEVADFDSANTSGSTLANPSLTLSAGAVAGMAFAALASGVNDQASVTAAANCTLVDQADFANPSTAHVVRQTNPATGDFAVGFTAAADDASIAGAMIVEAAGASAVVPTPNRSDSYRKLGSGIFVPSNRRF